jgi:hypothetical protein
MLMSRFPTMIAFAISLVLSLSSLAAGNCTQGFWKNHPEVWCVTSLSLGDVEYTQPELLSIFDQPVQGNGLVALAHQLIAAKLNVACGAASVDAIADADALIGSLVVPPVGAGFLETSATSDLVAALDAFNNLPGDPNGFGGCAPVSVEDYSWGRVKAAYR